MAKALIKKRAKPTAPRKQGKPLGKRSPSKSRANAHATGDSAINENTAAEAVNRRILQHKTMIAKYEATGLAPHDVWTRKMIAHHTRERDKLINIALSMELK